MSDTYLITGVAGFIGSHIAEEVLLNTPDSTLLLGIDNFYSGKRENLEVVEALAKKLGKKFIFHEIDIRDTKKLAIFFSNYSINYISHQAAIASVQTSIDTPKFTCDVNIRGTLNLLNLSKEHNIKRFVFASSAALYGNHQIIPFTETSPTMPISPYGFEKLLGEHYIELFHRDHGLETCTFRYFNVYGPRQDPASDYSGVISIFNKIFQKHLNDSSTPPPNIYGSGEQFRDFIFVKDVAKANFLAFHNNNVSGKTFCLGTGEGTNLLQLMNAFNKNCNLDLKPTFKEKRNGDPHASQSDNSKYCQTFNVSEFTPIDKGLLELNPTHQNLVQSPLVI